MYTHPYNEARDLCYGTKPLNRPIANLGNDMKLLEDSFDKGQEIDVKVNLHEWNDEQLAWDDCSYFCAVISR